MRISRGATAGLAGTDYGKKAAVNGEKQVKLLESVDKALGVISANTGKPGYQISFA